MAGNVACETSTFHACTKCVPRMYEEYHVCTKCIPRMYQVYTAYVRRVPRMYQVYTTHVPSVYRVCTKSTTHVPSVYHVCTKSTAYVPSVYHACTKCIPRMYEEYQSGHQLILPSHPEDLSKAQITLAGQAAGVQREARSKPAQKGSGRQPALRQQPGAPGGSEAACSKPAPRQQPGAPPTHPSQRTNPTRHAAAHMGGLCRASQHFPRNSRPIRPQLGLACAAGYVCVAGQCPWSKAGSKKHAGTPRAGMRQGGHDVRKPILPPKRATQTRSVHGHARPSLPSSLPFHTLAHACTCARERDSARVARVCPRTCLIRASAPSWPPALWPHRMTLSGSPW